MPILHLRLQCTSCEGEFTIKVVREPEDFPQRDEPDFNYYCPVCSSAEMVEEE